tara:strand:- start:1488 stop:2900 length:1413 start_codon:yes stop_codon:yes gene_type:complete
LNEKKLKQKMTLTQIICGLLKIKSNTIRKQIKDLGGFESMMQEIVECKVLQDRKLILSTLSEMCSDKQFAKDFANTLFLADILYEVFFSEQEFREDVISIALNVSKYMSINDVESCILPMISVHKFKNEVSFKLFRHILTRPLKLDWFKANQWIFRDLKRMLDDNNFTVNTLTTIFDIVNISNYCGDNKIAEFLRIGIWKSECREKLISLALSSEVNIMSFSQHILLNISFHMKNNKHIKCDFNEFEVYNFKLILNNIYAFPIFLLCNLSCTKNINILLDRQNVQTIENILLKESAASALSLHAADLLIHAYCYYNIPLTFEKLKVCKAAFNVLKHIQENEKSCFLNKMKHFVSKLDIGDIKELEEKVASVNRQSMILDRLQKNGIELTYPHEYVCPITQDIMNDPVVASDGHSYEREALVSFMKYGNGKSPLTRQKLTSTIIPNINLKKRIREHAEDICNLVEAKKNKC